MRAEAFIAPAAAVPAFFAGLLPEGRRLTALRRTVGTSADDEFSMLLAVGSDTIGDVQVLPAGDTFAGTRPAVIDDFSEVVFADLFAQAIGHRPDRVALPGVQDKISGQMLNVPVQGRSRASDRTMALPIGGRIRQQLSWPMLQSLSEAIGVPGRLAADVIREQAAVAGTWIEDLEQLPFDASTIRNLRRLAQARIRHIQPT